MIKAISLWAEEWRAHLIFHCHKSEIFETRFHSRVATGNLRRLCYCSAPGWGSTEKNHVDVPLVRSPLQFPFLLINLFCPRNRINSLSLRPLNRSANILNAISALPLSPVYTLPEANENERFPRRDQVDAILPLRRDRRVVDPIRSGFDLVRLP